ncbi:transposase [Elusimicrobiota bacterium]
MPRTARIVAIGLPHHITQRGNNKQTVFFDDIDRKYYLSCIGEYSKKYGLSILSYCLMSNHVHFIAIPSKEDSLSRTFNATHMKYAQYFNRKNNSCGHLWQGRFFSCVLDEIHLLSAARYIEKNPVRSKQVKKPWDWEWSSALANTGLGVPKIKLENIFRYLDMNINKWKKYIDGQEEENAVTAIRKHTLSGLPFGATAFIKNLENKFGKKLTSPKMGRPRKEAIK